MIVLFFWGHALPGDMLSPLTPWHNMIIIFFYFGKTTAKILYHIMPGGSSVGISRRIKGDSMPPNLNIFYNYNGQ